MKNWKFQQAYSIEKYPLEKREKFWVTQKLNGVRATFYNGKLISRNGNPFEGLEHIENELNGDIFSGLVLDGELTLRDKFGMSDNEAFRIASGLSQKKNCDKSAIGFTIFDAVPVNEFESNAPSIKYSERRKLLDNIAGKLDEKSCVSVLPILYYGNELYKIDVLLDQMIAEDKEGLMINLDVPYQRTRHNGILKVKRFYTMDLPIIAAEEGKGKLKGTLGALVLDFKGNEVRVGTGFSEEQRRALWFSKDSLVGTLCEVQYKEITKSKGMEKSLQFPTFVGLRTDKTEVSYC